MRAMTDLTYSRRIAGLLRRAPWLVRALYPLYQLTRPRVTMGVVGVLFDDLGRVLLAEHVYHPRLPWGLPGGAINRGEDPMAALQREMREELAIEVAVGVPLLVERTYFGHVDLAFMCHGHVEPVVSSSEILDFKWCRRNEIPPITNFQQRALNRAYMYFDSTAELAYDL